MEQFSPKIKLLSASAGTGKTYNLIQEISKALESTPAEKIAAITFTRAATRDIRNKVKDLGDLNVNTIHGFFAGILKEQSVYLVQRADFKILEEFDDKKLFMDSAAGVMLNKINSSEFEALFAEYGFSRIMDMLLKMEKKYSVIKDHLNTDINKLLEQERNAEYERLNELMPKDLNSEMIEPLSNFKGADCDSLEKLRAAAVGTAQKLKIVTGYKTFKDNIELLKNLIDYNMKTKGSAANWQTEEKQNQVKEALRKLNDLRKAVKNERLGEEWVIKQAARYRKLFFELFLDVHKAHEQKKNELDVLSYNDIEILTHRLVTENSRVRDFYRQKYNYIFVDEFQDTNTMQRDVLFEIAKNIFVVGDAKQSIYRFRNADVRVFMDTQQKCPKDQLKELKTNRRCLPAIINAVNLAFPQIFSHTHSSNGRKNFEADYLAFEPYRTDSDGIVKLFKAPSEAKHHRVFNHELEAKICTDIIMKGIKEGKTYGDFCLLFRSSTHMGEFEKLFREKGLPFVVYGGESRNDLLSSLRSLFSVILNPYDDLCMLEVLKLPSFYTDDATIYRMKQGQPSIYEGLGDHPVKRFITEMRTKKDRGSFTEFVAEVLSVSKFIPSASLIFTGQDAGAEEAILRGAMHVESEGEGIDYFLDFLYSMKEDDPNTKTNTIKLMTVHASKGLEFNVVMIPCLEDPPRPPKDLIVISEDGEVAVKLGDEESNTKFNTVLYRNIKGSEEEASIAESKRLLYVAMTRARNELYMISDFDKGSKGIQGKRWVDWLSEIFFDKKEDYKLPKEISVIAPKIKAVMMEDKNIVLNSLVKQSEHDILKRYSVSFIRDSYKKQGYKPSSGELGVGTIIHSILENWSNKDEVAKIYTRIGAETAKNISTIVDSFADSPLGQKILSVQDALCEHSFAFKDGNQIIAGRIDRINIYDDHVWILDYKTGVDPEDLPAYKAQIGCYVSYAQRAYKGKKVDASIVDVTQCKEYK